MIHGLPIMYKYTTILPIAMALEAVAMLLLGFMEAHGSNLSAEEIEAYGVAHAGLRDTAARVRAVVAGVPPSGSAGYADDATPNRSAS